MKDVKREPIRDGIGKALVHLGEQGLKPLVIAADLSGSDRSAWYAKDFPDYFLNAGVSEADAVSIAHGAAFMFARFYPTPIPVFVCTFASMHLLALKRFEAICSDNSFVIAHGSHGGLVGGDGETHNGTRVLAPMLALPNLTVIWPADSHQAYQLTLLATVLGARPYFIMTGRLPEPVFTEELPPTEIGKIQEVRPGNDLTLLAIGPMVWLAKLAADELAVKSINARVLNVHTLKPLDEKAVLAAAQETAKMITIEEHSITGGLNSITSQCLHRHGVNTQLRSIALPDQFLCSGSVGYLREQNGLTVENIVKIALTL